MAGTAQRVIADVSVVVPGIQPDVFALLGNHALLPTWAPGLKQVEVDDTNATSPGGVGAVRTLYPKIGPPGRETIVAFEPDHRLAYSASDASLRGLCTGHLTEISLESAAGGTRLRWVTRVVLARSWWRRVLAYTMFRWAAHASCKKLTMRRFPTQQGSLP